LGADTFPPTAEAFRLLLLRARYAPSDRAVDDVDVVLRSRSPGGIEPIGADGPNTLLILCGGQVYRVDHQAFELLLITHACARTPLRALLQAARIDHATGLELAGPLVQEGLLDAVGG
jgi:hypothetical protein